MLSLLLLAIAGALLLCPASLSAAKRRGPPPLTLNDVDTTKYTIVDGKALTYSEALPVLEGRFDRGNLHQRLEVAGALVRFGSAIKGRPIIQKLIRAYRSLPGTPRTTSLSLKQWLEMHLKIYIMAAVVWSGDSRRGGLLEAAAKDPNSEIRSQAADVKEDMAEFGYFSPGGIPAKSPALDPRYRGLYVFHGTYLSASQVVSELKKEWAAGDVDDFSRDIAGLGSQPPLVKEARVQDALIDLFAAVGSAGLSEDTVVMLKINMLESGARAGHSIAQRLLDKAANDPSEHVRHVAEQYSTMPN